MVVRVVVVLALAAAACSRGGFEALTPVDDVIQVDTPPPPPSCVALQPTCGPDGTSSCCASSVVPAGTFYRSYDKGVDGLFASQSFPAQLSDFRLDTYEVTVGRMRAFINAGMGTQQQPPSVDAGAHQSIAGSGWASAWNQYLEVDTPTLLANLKCNATYQTWTDAPGANENLPMNCLHWYEAFAFCAWDGGYLPTEAEWNYAAAGGGEQRAYPWSSPASALTIDCQHANFTPTTGACTTAGGPLAPVGSTSPAGDGRWGHADLAGSLWEKVLDTYKTPYGIASCNDCADLSSIDIRTVRGGAFNSAESSVRSGGRYYDPPFDRYIDMGVRCARPP